jgi:hypothetical protein
MVPTLWIVLGPLGQSIAAANLLGGVAHQALPAPYSTALQAFGVVYGVRPYLGLVDAWITVALRTAQGSLRGTLFLAAAAPVPAAHDAVVDSG